MCVRLLSTVVQGGIGVCQITIYCSTGGLMCVRLLSTVVQGD